MPVDDMLVWAAESNHYGAKRAKAQVPEAPSDEPEPSADFRSVIGLPPSPGPKRDKMPRWYEIGHCAAACSGRCSLHAGKREPQDSVKDASLSEHLQAQQRNQRRNGRLSFQMSDSPRSNLSSTSKPEKTQKKHRNSRLEFAGEQLMIGNVDIARAIVTEELERLKSRGGK